MGVVGVWVNCFGIVVDMLGDELVIVELMVFGWMMFMLLLCFVVWIGGGCIVLVCCVVVVLVDV